MAYVRPLRLTCLFLVLLVAATTAQAAQQSTAVSSASPAPDGAPQAAPASVPCESQLGQRIVCVADTSAGVVLVKSSGSAPCLLGKTWGYDNTSIWVSDGCAGEFVISAGAAQALAKP